MPGFQPIEDADYEEFNNIHIRRNHIWSDALRSLSKASFNPLVPIRVTFIGEAGIDEGGPGREFFSLALSKIQLFFMDPQALDPLCEMLTESGKENL